LTIALYPGTFDPLTLGHEDIARRAARLFDQVVIAVADSRAKRPFLDVQARVSLARQALADVPGIRVASFSGLLTTCAREWGADVVVRGVRTVADFEYEAQLAGMNRRLLPGFETVFLTPSEGTAVISATLVREIASMGGEISALVSPVIARAMAERVAQLRDAPAAG